MQLSPKAIRFIIEAVEFYQKHQEMRLHAPNISEEEEAADLANDKRYLESIKCDHKRHHDDLIGKPWSHTVAA